MQRTKIVCTIGPVSASSAKLTAMMKAGMRVARLNLSHGTHAEHRALMKTIRSVAKTLKLQVPIIADIQGPKIRLGLLPQEGVVLKNNQRVRFSTAIDTYKDQVLPVTYRQLHKDLQPGDRLLIDDGLIELQVVRIQEREIEAEVLNGGVVLSHKGMNFPDSHLSIGAMTQKDQQDIQFAVEQATDWIALSFVTKKTDVQRAKKLIRSFAKPDQVLPRILVKIEKHEAITVFDDLLKEADAIMVARGDLGVELPSEEVPIYQKRIIEACRFVGKPVVVATQMLDSMIRNPRPTRAEVSDVANAVFDHTSAVMLSGESANGNYPVQAVKMMSAIIRESEASSYDDVPMENGVIHDSVTAIAQTIQLGVEQHMIDGVLVSLELAPWAESIHRTHPEVPLFLVCPNATLARQVSIRWGVQAFVMKNASEQTFVQRALRMLQTDRLVRKGMRLAIVLGGRHGEGFDVTTV